MNIEISPKEYEKWLNWDDGNMYCQLLDIDGKTDWRLPTLDELYDINNCENDFVDSFYWSSTDSSGSNAWMQYMSTGGQGYPLKTDGNYVRPVRTI